MSRNIIGVIPARYKSKRFEGKALYSIVGKPLIQHVYETAKLSTSLTDLYVATDDKRIFDVVEEFSGKVIMTSEFNRCGTERVAEVAELLRLNHSDILVNIQGDQPVFNSKCIKELINPLLLDSYLLVNTLAIETTNLEEINNPNKVKVVINKYNDALYFSRQPIPHGRDIVTKRFLKHLGFYAYTRGFLEIYKTLPKSKLEKAEKLEQLRVIENGYNIKVVKTKYDSVSVDTEEDLKLVEETFYRQ